MNVLISSQSELRIATRSSRSACRARHQPLIMPISIEKTRMDCALGSGNDRTPGDSSAGCLACSSAHHRLFFPHTSSSSYGVGWSSMQYIRQRGQSTLLPLSLTHPPTPKTPSHSHPQVTSNDHAQALPIRLCVRHRHILRPP